MKELIKYLQDNLIKFKQVSDSIVSIDDQTYQLIEEEEGKIFDSTLEMLCDDTEEDNYIFNFGGKWYWSPKGTETKPEFNIVKYLGKANIESPFIPWLGVRGKYEILNGSRDYKDWCKKATFLNCEILGVCEKNTLAGVLQFQEECKKNNIKSILGATYTVYRKEEDFKYDLKFYAKNEDGWQTLLKINKAVLVDNNKFIDEKHLFEDVLLLNESVFVVADPKELKYKQLGKYKKQVDFYQYDSVKFDKSDRDREYLESLKTFIISPLQPVLIQDSFYLDEDENNIKVRLNQISGVRGYKSSNQYFKSFDEVYSEFDTLFQRDDERFDKLLNLAVNNLNVVSKECNFEIVFGNKYLPKYIMTKEEKKKYKTNENMFDCLIEDGLNKKIKPELHDKYRRRIEEEKEVIDYGKLRDYFLINWEQVKFCEEKEILTGTGRGSAAGSLISYLFNLTRIDPFDYDLLFSRFLTKERAKNSISDIDIDHDQHRRDEVKQHLIDKYGYNQCCSVGTNGTLQLKAAISGLGKLHGLSDYEDVRAITKVISKDENSWSDLIELATTKKTIKTFIKEYPDLINELQLILNGIKSESVHASAFIITPDNKTIFEWIPVRLVNKDGENILVSEWSGSELENTGFLKQDILGLLQLTKFKYQIESIKKETGVNIDIYGIPLNDKKVFESISKGYTKDIFQFGSKGLAEYIYEVQPSNINDLIVAVALYRPGAMESGFHAKWIKIKNGLEEPDFIHGWEDITKNTNGLLIYQEQVMFICQKVGGFDLEETDKVRKALGKKKPEILEKYKQRFISGGLKNSFTEQELKDQWEFIEKTSGYLFNLSHAACYAIMGYISSWFKVNYPLHFWNTSFTLLEAKDRDEKIPAYMAETNRSGDIKLSPTDINKSGDGFTPDFKNNSIYWSLNSVRMCGDKAVEQLVNDKKEKGEYFSFQEFCIRNVKKGSKVTKAIIENLIMSGAFDEIENITQPKKRYRLIEHYRDEYKIKIDKTKDIFKNNLDKIDLNWWWSLQQKKLSGFALFDFKIICDEYLDTTNKYYDPILIQDKESVGDYISTGGYINEIVIRQSVKGEYADVILDNNFEFTTIKFWQDQWGNVKDMLDQKEKSILLISGKVSFDKYRKKNIMVASDNSELLVID